MNTLVLLLVGLVLSACTAGRAEPAAGARELAVAGTQFRLDGQPFPCTGISFLTYAMG